MLLTCAVEIVAALANNLNETFADIFCYFNHIIEI